MLTGPMGAVMQGVNAAIGLAAYSTAIASHIEVPHHQPKYGPNAKDGDPIDEPGFGVLRLP